MFALLHVQFHVSPTPGTLRKKFETSPSKDNLKRTFAGRMFSQTNVENVDISPSLRYAVIT